MHQSISIYICQSVESVSQTIRDSSFRNAISTSVMPLQQKKVLVLFGGSIYTSIHFLMLIQIRVG